ncbi:zinc finger MYM-type protein 1-like [Hydra vulgaris]|uniref:zinc finger MYM-type protein 1-like n=1 Tax=Hydra vulgaris TaxID=6087 RepID=UPI001F5ED066|nr:zinc finger MYM-type protein 1-like [Hydra vulgaris]
MSIAYQNPEDSQGSQVNIQADDISRWPEKITAEFINYWAGIGPMDLYHSDVKSLNDKSAIQKAANSVSRKCTPKKFHSHEQSKDHIEAVWKTASRAKKAGRIDSKFAHEMDRHEHYWRSLLKRLISVFKFVCERGLALRGDNETIGSPNNGNYLGLLELLAEYDDFLGQHIKNLASRGSGHTSYLLSTVCEELVRLMGNRVLNEIISRLKLSKYYSVSLDSTADEGHIDQLTLIFRYMEQDRPVERFVKFLPNQGDKAEEMFRGLMSFLKDIDI